VPSHYGELAAHSTSNEIGKALGCQPSSRLRTLMTERAVHLPPRPEGNPRATTVVQRP
jgi:hypothetical protein